MEGDGRLRGQGGVDISDSSRCVQVYTLASKPDATYLPTYERDGERNGQFCDGAAAAAQVGDAKSSLGDVESSLGDTKSSLGDAKSSLGDAKSSLGDTKSSLGDAKSSLGDAES